MKWIWNDAKSTNFPKKIFFGPFFGTGRTLAVLSQPTNQGSSIKLSNIDGVSKDPLLLD